MRENEDHHVDEGAEPIDAVQVSSNREQGWRGRVTAALIGGSLLSFVLGMSVTIYVPGFDGLDQAFMGGLVLTLTWPLAMMWALFARSGWGAWKRVLVPFVVLAALNAVGLTL